MARKETRGGGRMNKEEIKPCPDKEEELLSGRIDGGSISDELTQRIQNQNETVMGQLLIDVRKSILENTRATPPPHKETE